MAKPPDALKLAAEFLNAGNDDAADRIAADLLTADPRSINALRLMGAIMRKRGLLEHSLDYFHRALALNERSGLLHFELGTAYTELQRSEEAFEFYHKAVQLDPKLQPALVNLSAIMEQHERYEYADGSESPAVVALKVGGTSGCGFEYEGLIDEAIDELLLDAREALGSFTLEGLAGCV